MKPPCTGMDVSTFDRGETVKPALLERRGVSDAPTGASAPRAPRRPAAGVARWCAGLSSWIAVAAFGVAPLALASNPARPSTDAGTDLGPRFAATAPLTLVPQEGLQRLALPLPVLQASRSPGWADVRVLDAAGRPVPLAWLPRPPAPSAQDDPALNSAALPALAWPAAPTSPGAPGGEPANVRVRVDSAGAVVQIEPATPAAAASGTAPPRTWLLDLSALPRPSRPVAQLRLDWPAQPQGLSTRVRVEGSEDARGWSPVAEGPLLELPPAPPSAGPAPPPTSTPPSTPPSTPAPGVRQVEWPAGVTLPRYLRLTFEQPLSLREARLRFQPAAAAPVRSRTPVQFQAVKAEGAQPAHWTLDLQGPVPLEELALNLPEVNTVVALRLEQRQAAQEVWRPVLSFTAWRLQRQGQEQQSPAVEWSAATTPAARFWRLVPDTPTALSPAPALAATVGWQAPALVVVAQGGGPLRLVVGRDGETPATVPWTQLVPGADAAALARLPEAQVGPLTPQTVTPPSLNERLRSASAEDQRRWLLWAVLAAAVLGLAVLAWRLGRDMKTTPPSA